MMQSVVNESLSHSNIASIERLLARFNGPDASLFQSGDIVTVEKASGERMCALILGDGDNDHLDAALYNGMPHYFQIGREELAAMRIVRVEQMCESDVAMYRNMLGLS
ncbi:hypothetical protein [Sinorhizobium medicae]|uniref:Cyclic nucleotide-binding domain-containing protein n=1 Tax=Sinorhizobium medicae TaxID=110321 RepID=A0ABX4TLN2_9HYPH|nr:hypothetical protein [Sinorhizobium medicae]PLU03831.1 hypothetical protein BMJ33_13085 [Sinorhizobium medicae]PLU17461.1 hypothetical protein BMJ29_21110 [Sinorhizobium medicae]PLU77017.1 hypothetical protein BMJ19_26330 [Sinorhizobium medicae]